MKTVAILNDLTERQRDIVEFIIVFIEERGHPPTLREIGAEVGLTSTSSVDHQLRLLEKLGVIVRVGPKRAARAIAVPAEKVA